MKSITAFFLMTFPLVAVACAGSLGGMGGGCGMGGHAGPGSGAHEPHTHVTKAPQAVNATPDPNFDADRTRRILEAYERIVTLLSDDTIAGVEESAAVIVKQAPNDAIREAATPLSHPDEERSIARVRERFKPLSEAVVLYVVGNHEGLEAVLLKDEQPMPRKAYCPMVETAWLQHGKKITNPFYGSGMLRCGEFQEWAAGN
jgi:hypothetical protein